MSTSEDKPPVFASWRSWYTLVLGVLVIQMLLYYWLTRSFA
ncbi:hypothetical protein [Chryseosolibacter histidini]|nr:hypothetical protein [Chryseosolibacter histidini]